MTETERGTHRDELHQQRVEQMRWLSDMLQRLDHIDTDHAPGAEVALTLADVALRLTLSHLDRNQTVGLDRLVSQLWGKS